jgi:ATP-dependent exoDNAse (exonuclease V) beta subunit
LIRHFLYAAATRAGEQLYLTGVDPISEFVEDTRLG